MTLGPMLGLFALAVFAVGLAVGWILTKDSEESTETKLRIAVAIVITLVWGTAIIAEILIAAYTVSMLVHGIMGSVVAYLFAETALQTINGKDE